MTINHTKFCNNILKVLIFLKNNNIYFNHYNNLNVRPRYKQKTKTQTKKIAQ